MDVLLAKPNKELIVHMLETGRIAGLLLTRSIYSCDLSFFAGCFDMSEEDALNFICYLASIHDIGKAHKFFQRRIRGEKFAVKFRHEYESKLFFERYWSDVDCVLSDNVRYFGDVLALHHQKYYKNDELSIFDENLLYKVECKLHDQVIEKYDIVFPKIVKNADVCGCLLTAIIIFADWIASSEGVFRSDFLEEDVLKFFEDAHISLKNMPSFDLYGSVWPYIKVPSFMQQQVKRFVDTHADLPMLTIIEDVPGSGKTEAGLFIAWSLMIAYGKSGLYIGLPTSAIAGAMCDRYNDVLQRFNIVDARLLYGDAWLKSSDSQVFSNDAENWFKPLRLAMLQQNGVGTVDQAIMSVLPNKFSVLRLLGLSSKVLVVDEIHAYDAFMQGELETLLSYCKGCHIPVVLLSATLSDDKKLRLLKLYLSKKNMSKLVLLQDYPLLTVVDRVSKDVEQISVSSSFVKSYALHVLDNRDSAVDLLIQRVQSEDCCGFYIADTIKSAQTVYQAIKQRVSDDVMVLLFHAGFSVARRREIEDECLRFFGKDRSVRPKKAILIATQVIEQSLDLSGDFLITEPCGMDLFIQRVGRIWRHLYDELSKDGKLPDIYMISDTKLSKFVYEQNVDLIVNTLNWIKTHDKLTVPNDVRSAIASVVPKETSLDVRLAGASMFAGESNTLPIPEGARYGVVASKLFTQSGLRSYFSHDEDSVYAVTREGRRSVGVCLIPPSLYDEVVLCSGIVPMRLIRMVQEYKVNRPYEDWMKEYMHNDLVGVNDLVLLQADEEFEPTETGSCIVNKRYVRLDKDFGLMIQGVK